MRVLVARPLAQAEATGRRLALRGYGVLVAPVLTVEPLPFRLPRRRPDAILVTSANAVPAAAAHLARWRSLPVFATGRRSAASLSEAGFARVLAGAGSGADLVRLVAGTLPAGARLLHLAGQDRKAEPGRGLKAAGYAVSVREVYAAAAVSRFPEGIAEALAGGTLDAALHYSRRSAEILVGLAEEAGLARDLARLDHICLSADVAAALTELAGAAPEVAAAPTENALLAALDRVAAARASSGRVTSSGARAPDGTGAIHKPNPARQDAEPREDSRIPMSDPRRSDPLRREAPIIDLPASEVSRPGVSESKTPAGSGTSAAGETSEVAEAVVASSADEEPASAIEPVATTGLGPDPFPLDPKPAAEPSDTPGEAAPAVAAVDDKPGEPEPASPVAAASSIPGVTKSFARKDEAAGASSPTHRDHEPPPRRTGALLAASLIGGLIGAAIVAAIGYALLPPGDLAGRMTALETRMASLPATPGNLDARIAGLEGGLKQATDTANAARAAADTAVKQAQSTPAQPPSADPALRSEIATLTTRSDDTAKLVAAGAASLKDLSGKLDGLQGRVQESLVPSVAALQTGLRTMGETVQTLKTGAGTLETRSVDQDRRLTALSGDLAKLSPQAFQAGLRVAVASRLDDALRSGAPLRPAIAALGKLGAPASSLAPLEPYAEAPAPGAAALASQFRPLAEKILAPPGASGEGFGERLRRVAEKVVTVRVVGDGSGSDLPALVARIQASLARADLPAAAAEWETLPAGAKTISAAWATQLKGRVAADAAARRIAADALGALDTAVR